MYTLKSTLKRGMTLSASLGLVVASFASMATPVFADALNPLTERSLTLSSSSPGWADTDGSGNSTYAPPNSGANGKKTGNYFSFKVSSDSTTTPIKAMTFQYCTKPAGNCTAPGNDAVHGTDNASLQQSDLNVHYVASAQEVGDTDRDGAAGDVAKVFDLSHTTNKDGNVSAVPGYTNSNPKYQANGGTGDAAEAAKDVPGTYLVVYRASDTVDWQVSQGWTVSTSNQEEASTGTTGQQNTIVLENADGQGLPAGAQVKVMFFATDDNYITNPGEGAFFVKINTFKNFPALSDVSGSENTLMDNLDPSKGYVIDGGVTVANVMNESIQITTKVLETMQFSVGTVDPNTLESDGTATSQYAKAMATTGETKHGVCDTILKGMTPTSAQNVLELGDQDSESSLSTKNTYATHSYWRLSSNSSAGATVYYSGHTLSNTSGDEIKAIGKTMAEAHAGTEQFGLAIDTAPLAGGHGFDDATLAVNYSTDRTGGATPKLYENAADNDVTGVDDTTLTDNGADLSGTPDYSGLNGSFHMPRLNPLTPFANYGSGYGQINADGQDPAGDGTKAQFAFDTMSDTVPAPIASESSEVVDCVTAKMRYIANIAATTPAGIYTTKINYIAAPQY